MNAVGGVLVALAVGVLANFISYFALAHFDQPTILRVTNGSAELKNVRFRAQPYVETTDEGIIMTGSEIELIRHERPALRIGLSLAIAVAVFVILLVVLLAV